MSKLSDLTFAEVYGEDFAGTEDEQYRKGNLVYIPTYSLYPHPDNPRKDLGDLTELADSIKANGVMQNLTVVPGHYVTDDEYAMYTKMYSEEPSEEVREILNRAQKKLPIEGGYTVIIGHRRCSAAKKAGLTELPCVIVDMSIQDQVSTMLLENMQRSDLTIYEQAEGIQMMFDLGETVETVKKKTGLSDSTIRNRRKLLVFDREAFKKSEGKQVTMGEYLKLTDLKDVTRANYLLSIIGTKNFDYEYDKAKRDERRIELQGRLEALLKEKAVEITPDDTADKRSVTTIYGEPSEKDLEMVRSSHVTGKIYWYKNQYGYYLFRKQTAEDKLEKAQKDSFTEAWNALNKEREELWENIIDRVKRYVMNEYRPKKGDMDKLHAAAFEFFVRDDGHHFNSWIEVARKLGVNVDAEDFGNPEAGKSIMECYRTKPEETVLKWLVYHRYWTNPGGLYYRTNKLSYQNAGREIMLFKALESIGYEVSTEEWEYLNGTHEIFKRVLE